MLITGSSTLRDFVVVLDDGLPTTMSTRILDEYRASAQWRQAAVETDRPGDGVRNCDVLDMSDPATIGDHAARAQLLTDATTLVGGWAKTYEHLTTRIDLTGRTGLGVARYRTGGFYKSHHDNHTDEVRTVTVIAVLDTDFTGGELSLFRGDHVLDLQPGQVCMFPATFQYSHSVEPVQSGTRYSMLTWLN